MAELATWCLRRLLRHIVSTRLNFPSKLLGSRPGRVLQQAPRTPGRRPSLPLDRGRSSVERVNVLGVGVSAINLDDALTMIAEWVARREPHYVCVTSVHGIVESQRDARLRAIHNRASLVTTDGMPLVWLCRLAGFRTVGRVYGPELMLELCKNPAARGWRHFFYGGGVGVADRLAARLQGRFPQLKVAGTFSPPFRPLTVAEEAELEAQVAASSADVVWVGLSTPKQERWMAAHVGRLAAPVLIGVGAAFDFHAGLKPQAPRWIQRSGFEWLFRLANEPRRLAPRYLRSHPIFVVLLILQLLGLRRTDLGPTEGEA